MAAVAQRWWGRGWRRLLWRPVVPGRPRSADVAAVGGSAGEGPATGEADDEPGRAICRPARRFKRRFACNSVGQQAQDRESRSGHGRRPPCCFGRRPAVRGRVQLAAAPSAMQSRASLRPDVCIWCKASACSCPGDPLSRCRRAQPRSLQRLETRGTRARAGPRACKIRASARVEAEVGDEPGRLSQRNASASLRWLGRRRPRRGCSRSEARARPSCGATPALNSSAERRLSASHKRRHVDRARVWCDRTAYRGLVSTRFAAKHSSGSSRRGRSFHANARASGLRRPARKQKARRRQGSAPETPEAVCRSLKGGVPGPATERGSRRLRGRRVRPLRRGRT
jgi:hypothetical protein